MSTAQLVAEPDDALSTIILETQDLARHTQSEAYIYLTSLQHDGIDAGDAIEIRCAPDPIHRVELGEFTPAALPIDAGELLAFNDQLYRCHDEEWVETTPEWAARSLSPETDVQISVFSGVADKTGAVTLANGMKGMPEADADTE